ncbi:MAG: tetratricopeptide repeat protein [Fimbriimonadales bacterium]
MQRVAASSLRVQRFTRLLPSGRGVAVALCLALAFHFASAQPLLLIFPDLVPSVQHNNQLYDPNIDLKPHLMPFLEELRKVQVEWYSPTHAKAQQFAERRNLDAEQLTNPTPVLRGQLARAWGATYVMTVRCTRPPEKAYYEYQVKVWELGKRTPAWESEGFQQMATGAGQQDGASALQTLGRTIALRLDSELWASLPRVAEPVRTPATAPVPRTDSPLPADPKQLATKLLGEGKSLEALPSLRAAVNAEPMDADLRLMLARLYRRLNLRAQAQRELERALELFPRDERFALEQARLLYEGGDLAAAATALQNALTGQPGSLALRLALFDLLLEGGDPSAAERVLPLPTDNDAPEIAYRRYLLQGAKRTLENLPPSQFELTEERAALWFLVASGLTTDLASELLDLRRLMASPIPNWAELRLRSERAVLTALSIGRWAEQVQPNNATRTLTAHVRFACQMLAQSAQHMARYVLSRQSEEEERASLLRIEAMRELEAAKNALPKRLP